MPTTKSLYILCEIIPNASTTQGFKVLGATDDQDEAFKRTTGNLRFFTELEQVADGLWQPKEKLNEPRIGEERSRLSFRKRFAGREAE